MADAFSLISAETLALAEDMVEHLEAATRRGDISRLKVEYHRADAELLPGLVSPFGPPAIMVSTDDQICLNALAAWLLNNGWGRI